MIATCQGRSNIFHFARAEFCNFEDLLKTFSMSSSFYDLDYIISINQKRLEEYNAYLQKVLERLTNIILIYSGLGIFLVPVIQHVMNRDIRSEIFYLIFIVFSALLIVSLIYFVRLILPVQIAYLDPPEKYYKDFRQLSELDYPGDQIKVDQSLKGSYILELERAIDVNYQVFRRKSSFFYNALLWALLAVIPFVICIVFHLTSKRG
jgi:hypothetical protein